MWKKRRIVNTGIPTQSVLPFEIAIISESRHLRDVELLMVELAPEDFGGIERGGMELDRFWLNLAADDRTRAVVVEERGAESEPRRHAVAVRRASANR